MCTAGTAIRPLSRAWPADDPTAAATVEMTDAAISARADFMPVVCKVVVRTTDEEVCTFVSVPCPNYCI